MKQLFKNFILVSLVMISVIVIFLTISSMVILMALPVQSTEPGGTILEGVAMFVLFHPIISSVLASVSVLMLIILKEPFNRFLKRNKFVERAEAFFTDN